MDIVERLREQQRLGLMGLPDDFDIASYGEAADHIEALREALETFLIEYVEMVNSGDCGFWDPEKEDKVIAARAALGKGPSQ